MTFFVLQKLEEAQHYYDEKLSEKDDIITALQEKVHWHQIVNFFEKLVL